HVQPRLALLAAQCPHNQRSQQREQTRDSLGVQARLLGDFRFYRWPPGTQGVFQDALDYARELWKLTNRVSGDSAVGEAAALAAKWLARGLSADILHRVAYEVFSIRLGD
ncbi:MAG: hypothetical protein R6X14_05290, partial [bacterium]